MNDKVQVLAIFLGEGSNLEGASREIQTFISLQFFPFVRGVGNSQQDAFRQNFLHHGTHLAIAAKPQGTAPVMGDSWLPTRARELTR